jgi:hypothetical protein
MQYSIPPIEPQSAAGNADRAVPVGDARTLLAACLDQYAAQIAAVVEGSLEGTDDLFEFDAEVNGDDLVLFRDGRAEWLATFTRMLRELVNRRFSGLRRKGRRADADVSVANLQVLSAYDQEMQTAVTRAANALAVHVRKELLALDARIAELLPDPPGTEPDNPFGVAYLLDAIGASARRIYPNPRVWRPLMQRLLSDLRPTVVKIYISLNRFLADHDVLPDIKATLRARSELRPASDSDLLPLFERMLKATAAPGAATQVLDVVVPSIEELRGPYAATPVLRQTAPAAGMAPAVIAANAGATARAARPTALRPDLPPAVVDAFYAAYARHLESAARLASEPEPPTMTAASDDAFALPVVDSTLALGALRDTIVELDRWQRFEPPGPPAGGAADTTAQAGVPLNRLPLIRDAIGSRFANTGDRMTMDVVTLIFDYIFRDRSIPDSQRRLFARLQVPIAKAALVDRSFFSDRKHPARRLLDELAAAAVGANADPSYQQEFETLAGAVIGELCDHFGVDVTVFEAAGEKIRPFVAHVGHAEAAAAHDDIGAALANEETEADAAQVRVALRDRLAGMALPFEVRSFAETLWADHLTVIRTTYGENSDAWKAAMVTLDDLLWSISAKERTAQKARLTRLIPSLIRRLRAGIADLPAAAERAHGFFESLYRLHIAVLRPADKAAPAAGAATAAPSSQPPALAAAGATEPPAAEAAEGADTLPFDPATVHDFANEMVVGTWVLFRTANGDTPARLFWVSPLRTRYVFTTRQQGKAISLTPEALARQLNAGRASVIVEPVPLFDRAVSAALDTLAANARDASEAA